MIKNTACVIWAKIDMVFDPRIYLKKIQCVFWIGLAAKRLLGSLKCMGFLSDGGTIMKYAWRGARVFNVLKEEADDEASLDLQAAATAPPLVALKIDTAEMHTWTNI